MLRRCVLCVGFLVLAATSSAFAQTLTWSGLTNANWSLSGTDTNWTGPADFYSDGSAVQFSDGASNPSITIVGTVQPSSVTFTNTATPYVFTGGAISGSGSVVLNGGGTVTFSNGGNSYSGGTTVNSGTLTLTQGGGTGDIRGVLNINPGAYVNLGATDSLGYNGGASVTTVNNNGGVLNIGINGNNGYITSYTLTAGTMTSTGGGAYNIDGTNYPITTLASNASSVISANIALRANTVNFNVALGTTPNGVDLLDSGVISGGYAISKSGAGNLQLSNYNTYSGGTTVSGGTLTLTNGGGTGTIRGPLNINPGAYVSLINNTDDLGYNSGTSVTTVSNSGGIIDDGTGGNQGYITNFVLTGGSMTSTGGGSFNFNGTSVSSNASSITSVVSAPLDLRGGTFTATVAQGTTASGVDLLFSGVIHDGGAFAKAGPGLAEFTAANTFTGGATISGGTLQIGDGVANNGALTCAATNNSVLVFADPTAYTYGYAISGSGNLIKIAAGDLTLNTRGTFTGNVIVSGGTVTCPTINNGNSTVLGENAGSRTITVNSGADLLFTTNNVFYGGGTSAANLPTLVINNGGLVSSTRYNALGNVNLSGGTLDQNATDGTGTAAYQGYELLGSVTVSGTAPSYITNSNLNGANDHLFSGGTTFNVGSTNSGGPDLIVSAGLTNSSGDYGGNGSLTKTGAGTMNLIGANNYSGSTTIKAGTLQLGDGTSGHDPTLTTSIIYNNAALVYDINATQTANYPISGPGSLTVIGGGELELGGLSNFNNNFNNFAAFTGNTTIAAGTVQLTNNGALGLSNVTVNGGLLDLNGYSPTVNALSGSGTVDDAGSANSSTLSVGNLGGSGTFSGSILSSNGPLSLNVVGGSLTLTNTNTYVGATTVTAGTLALAGSGSIAATPSISVFPGGVLDVSRLTSPFTLSSTQVLTAGRFGTPATDINGSLVSSGTIANVQGPLTINGGLTLTAGAVLTPNIGPVTANQISLSGPLHVTGATTVQPYFLANGTYTLISAPSVSGGSNLSLLPSLLGNSNFRGTAVETLTTSSTGATVTISGLTPATLTWTGANGTAWDVNTSTNWNNNTTTLPDVFFHGDAVSFNDTAAGTTVTIPANVYPSSVTVTTTGTYTISGPGAISGPTSLVTNGSGNLILTTSNTYAGGTTISGGNLALGSLNYNGPTENVNSLGTGPVTINGGGQLQFGPGGTANVFDIPNAITLNGGTVWEQDGFQVLQGALTIGPSGGNLYASWNNKGLFVTNVISGSGALTLAGGVNGTGAGNIYIYNVNPSYTGVATLNGGVIVNINNANAFAGATVNSNGATVDFGQATAVFGGLEGNTSFALPTSLLTVGGNSAVTTYSGVLSGGGSLQVVGSGSLTLAGVNTYTGATTLNGGVLNVSSLANINTASGIGAGSAGGSPADLVFGGGSLQYTGATTTSTNRLFTIGDANGNSATLDSSGPGASTMSFTSTGSIALVNAAPHSLTLTGSNTSVSVFAPLITDQSVGNPTSLTKSGAGTWSLTAAETYTGPTNITAGTLIIDHSSLNLGALANTPVTIGAGGALQVRGTTSIGGTITSNSGAVSLVDGTINTLTVGGGLNLNSSALGFDLGSSGGTAKADLIAIAGPVTLSGTETINLSAASGESILAGTVTIVSALSGGLSTGGTFVLGTKPAGFFNFTLGNSNTAETVTLTGNPTPATAYWTGAASRTGSDTANHWGYGSGLATQQSNWSTTPNGLTDPLQVPGGSTNVFFTATNAVGTSGTLSTTLDSAYSVQGLTFAVPASTGITSTVINTSGNLLAIGTGGLTMGSATDPTIPNASAVTISGGGGIQIGGSQTWANNNTLPLTVGPNINGTASSGNVQTLTLGGSGAGGVTLSGSIVDGTNGGQLALALNQAGLTLLGGANTYSGGTTISSGTVQLGTQTSLGVGNLTVNGGLLNLNGFGPSIPVLSGAGGTIDNLTASTVTLSVGNGGGAGTFSGSILSSSGAISLAQVGGMLTLMNTNSYGGATTVTAGTLTVGSTGLLPATTALTDNSTVNFNNPAQTIASLNVPTGAIVNLNASNLNVTGGGTVAGLIQSTGSLTVSGGSLALNNYNTYTGGTTVNGGTLELNVGGGVGAINGTLTVNSGGVVNFNANNALGYNGGNQQVTVMNINNGGLATYFSNNGDQGWGITINLSGGTLSSNLGVSSATANSYYALGNNSSINTTASSTATSYVLGRINLRENNPNNQLTFNVARGSAPIDLVFNADITASAATYGILKEGTGIMEITSVGNSYTGPTTISGGTLQLGDGTSGDDAVLTTSGITDNAALVYNVFASQTANYAIGGSGSVSLRGTGVLTLGSGTNTYTGATTVNGGTMNVAALGNIAAPSSIGTGSSAGSPADLVFGGGSLQYTNNGATSTNRLFTIGDAAGNSATLDSSGGGAMSFTATGSIAFGTTGAHNLTLTGNAAGPNIFAPVIGDQAPGSPTSVTMNSTGIWALSGLNTYSGVTTIDNGTLNVSSLANINTASGIGKGSVAGSPADLIFGNGTLQYTGATPVSTNRLFTIGDVNGNSATLDSSAASPAASVSFTGTGAIVLVNAAPHSLTLTGSNYGSNSFAPSIGDQSAGNPTSVTMNGPGTWALAGANTYTGPTNVNGGILIIDHSGAHLGALGNTAVTVASGATLQVKGSTSIGNAAAGPLSVQGTLSLWDNSINTLSVGSGGLNIGGSVLDFDVGTSNGSSDLLKVAGAVSSSSPSTVNLNFVGAVASGPTSYTLISATGGGLSSSNFALGPVPPGFNEYALSTPTADALVLSVTANATPAIAYWTGLASAAMGDAANKWTDGYSLATQKSNWSTTPNGLTDPKQVPGSSTSVYFTASNASAPGGTLSSQLDGNYSINSITFDTSSDAPVKSVAINTDGNTLTVGPGGLTVGPLDTSTTTISTSGTGSVLIGTSQNWANNSNTQGLTVSAGINGTGIGATQTLTFSGTGKGGITLSGPIGDGANNGQLALAFNQAGTTVLGGANTYSGGTTISSGTVQLAAASGATLGSASGPLTFSAGSTGHFQLNGNSLTIGDLNTNAASPGTPVIESASGLGVTGNPDTLSVNAANVDTFAGVLRDGSGQLALNMVGAGTLVLTGSNTYTGGTTVTNGVLQLGNGTAAGNIIANTSTVALNGGSLSFNLPADPSFAGTINLAANSAIGNIGPSPVTLAAASTFNGEGNTLTVYGAKQYLFFNSGAGNAPAQVNIVSGFAAEDLAQAMPLAGAPIAITAGGAFATVSSSGNGGTVINSIALNGGAGPDGNGALQNLGGGVVTYSGPISLLAGNSSIGMGPNALSTDGFLISGVISGPGGLTKIGSNTVTLNAYDTYIGGTTVNGGTLVLNQGGGQATIQGTLTINPGATVSLAVTDALGYTVGEQVTTVTVNGGVIDDAVAAGNEDEAYTTNFILNGGTMTTSGGGSYHFTNGYGITTLASSATSLIGANITIRDNATLPINVARGTTPSGVDLNISGVINLNFGGTGGILKSGPGLLALSGNMTYSGSTAISGGTLQLGNGGNTGSIAASPVTDNAVLAVSRSDSVNLNSLVAGGTVAGTGALVQIGSGTLILSSTDTYTGGTYAEAGTLVDAANEAIPDGTSLTVGPGATLVFDSTQAGSPVVGASVVSGREVAAVPEPGTIMLLVAALGSAVVYRRIRRRTEIRGRRSEI